MVLRFQLFIDVLHAILKCLFRFLLLVLFMQFIVIFILLLPGYAIRYIRALLDELDII